MSFMVAAVIRTGPFPSPSIARVLQKVARQIDSCKRLRNWFVRMGFVRWGFVRWGFGLPRRQSCPLWHLLKRRGALTVIDGRAIAIPAIEGLEDRAFGADIPAGGLVVTDPDPVLQRSAKTEMAVLRGPAQCVGNARTAPSVGDSALGRHAPEHAVALARFPPFGFGRHVAFHRANPEIARRVRVPILPCAPPSAAPAAHRAGQPKSALRSVAGQQTVRRFFASLCAARSGPPRNRPDRNRGGTFSMAAGSNPPAQPACARRLHPCGHVLTGPGHIAQAIAPAFGRVTT